VIKTADDARYMALALSLGARGLGRVWPNPAVGCVIVAKGRIVGRGWTADGGRPHGETAALSQAGRAAKGATAYVTLEPCAHYGKTPPCAQNLINARVTRVVTALEDPDPRVAGKGHAMLQEAGVELLTGIGRKQASEQHKGFLLRINQGRPMVTLKMASSFDGRIALQNGQSRWITGPQARRMVHLMRSRHDAVLIGGGTARKDDPSLDVRDLGVSRQPVRVVASRNLDIPLAGKLANAAMQHSVWICHGVDADPTLISVWQGLGAKTLACEIKQGQLCPISILQALGANGLTRVFCEGGGSFAASLLKADVVDELVGFTAGVVIGADGRPMLGSLGLQQLNAAQRFDLVQSRQVGGDVMHHWTKPVKANA